eukprot:5988925-Pleurochrysis_carterae.AAC.1
MDRRMRHSTWDRIYVIPTVKRSPQYITSHISVHICIALNADERGVANQMARVTAMETQLPLGCHMEACYAFGQAPALPCYMTFHATSLELISKYRLFKNEMRLG